MNNTRITILDSLRVFAIFTVFLHHFYSPSIYPEIGKLFYHGGLGVPLFFVISGFVISLTLGKTKDLKTYLKNRFIRLSPAMLVSSTIIFTFFYFFYTGEGYANSKNIYNYLIANTFIDPHVFDLYSGEIKYYYLDNAFWSLWIEICFYTIIGVLYFYNKTTYLRNYIILLLIGIPLYLLFSSSIGHNILSPYFTTEQLKYYKLVSRCLAFFNESLWFLIGIYFYKLFYNKDSKKYLWIIMFICSLIVLKERSIGFLVFSILVVTFIYLFTYKPKSIHFLENKYLIKIGQASYIMYLIHYHLGVVLVKYLNEHFSMGYFSPILVIALVVIFGLVMYNTVEKKLIILYKKILN